MSGSSQLGPPPVKWARQADGKVFQPATVARVNRLSFAKWVMEKRERQLSWTVLPALGVGAILIVLHLFGNIERWGGIIGAVVLVWAIVATSIIDNLRSRIERTERDIEDAEKPIETNPLWLSRHDPLPSTEEKAAMKKAKGMANRSAERDEERRRRDSLG